MQDNTSATGGFLSLSPAPSSKELEDILHDFIAGITGLDGDLVRPRWQEKAPNIPKRHIDWCAFGITYDAQQLNPEIIHHAKGDGFDEVIDHERLVLTLSFYGPFAKNKARDLRLALYLPQNREFLKANNLNITSLGQILSLPEETGGFWRAREDMEIFLSHKVSRKVAVKNILKSTGSLEADRNYELIVGHGCQGEEKK